MMQFWIWEAYQVILGVSGDRPTWDDTLLGAVIDLPGMICYWELCQVIDLPGMILYWELCQVIDLPGMTHYWEL